MQKLHSLPLDKRFGLIQAGYWAFIGTFCIYITTLMDARGMSSTQIGLLTSLMTGGAIFGQFAVGGTADATRRNRLILLITCGLILLASLGLYFSSGIAAYAVFIFCLGFLKEPSYAVLDSWIIKSYGGDMTYFGSIRSKGSIAFACLMLVYGYLLSVCGFALMPIASSVVLALLIVLILSVPELKKSAPNAVETTATDNHPSLVRALKTALTPMLMMLLGIFFLLGLSVNPVYNFFPLVLFGMGGTTTHQGMTYFSNAMMEFPFMRGKKLKQNYTALGRLIISTSMYILSTLLLAFTNNVWALIVLMGLNGAAYGIQLPARRELITKLVPERFQTTLHGVTDMVYSSLGAMIGNTAAGAIMDVSGSRTMLLLLSLCQLIAGLMFILLNILKKRKENVK